MENARSFTKCSSVDIRGSLVPVDEILWTGQTGRKSLERFRGNTLTVGMSRHCQVERAPVEVQAGVVANPEIPAPARRERSSARAWAGRNTPS
jgi:hypothetical protein